MLSILAGIKIVSCKSNQEKNLQIKEEPKLLLMAADESIGAHKNLRVLQFQLNEEVDIKDIKLKRYKMSNYPKEKYSFFDDFKYEVELEDTAILRTKGEGQVVSIQLGDINIDNLKEFNQTRLKKLEDNAIFVLLTINFRITKISWLKHLQLYIERTPLKGTVKQAFEMALNDEVWENLKGTDVESIKQHFETLKTRVYQRFLMYCIIEATDHVFNKVFKNIEIVNDEGKTLETKDDVLYIFKEMIRKCRRKFVIEIKSNCEGFSFMNRDSIMKCIYNKFDETLKDQYPSEKNIQVKYVYNTEHEIEGFRNLSLIACTKQLIDEVYYATNQSLSILDTPLGDYIEDIQKKVREIDDIRATITYEDIKISCEFCREKMESYYESEENDPHAELILKEYDKNINKIYEMEKTIKREKQQIEILDILNCDNVAFGFSVVSRHSKTKYVDTKYYRFVNETEIEEITEDELVITGKQSLKTFYWVLFGLIGGIVIVSFVVWYKQNQKAAELQEEDDINEDVSE